MVQYTMAMRDARVGGKMAAWQRRIRLELLYVAYRNVRRLASNSCQATAATPIVTGHITVVVPFNPTAKIEVVFACVLYVCLFVTAFLNR